MITGVPPYPKLIKKFMDTEVDQSHSELYNSFLTKITSNLFPFLQKIFKMNPLERPTATDLLKDAFISNPKKNPDEITLLLGQISL